MDDFKFKFKYIVLTSKNTDMSVSFLYSLTTVRVVSFQSSVTNSDIFSQWTLNNYDAVILQTQRTQTLSIQRQQNTKKTRDYIDRRAYYMLLLL